MEEVKVVLNCIGAVASLIVAIVGLMILMQAFIMIITFFAWVIKLEFDWFFGLDIFKWCKEKSLMWREKKKLKLAKKLVPLKMEIDKSNEEHGPIGLKNKEVMINEEMGTYEEI